MTYLRWTCTCGNEFTSISHRNHTLDQCPVCHDYVDYEEYGLRYGGNISELPKTFKKYDVDFFTEILMCLEAQGYPILIEYEKGKSGIELKNVLKIRKIEDSLLKTLW